MKAKKQKSLPETMAARLIKVHGTTDGSTWKYMVVGSLIYKRAAVVVSRIVVHSPEFIDPKKECKN